MGSIQNRSETEVSYPSGAGQEDYTQLKKKNDILKKKLDQLTLALDLQLSKTQNSDQGSSHGNRKDYVAL
jgi:hypothetical protein